tara:strand:+ start:9177 stop:9500 length:324 start_codon:yes stop_codon:yes gene_type:complete
MSEFDFEGAKEARDEGMKRAEVNADPEWVEDALACIKKICERQRAFTSEDVWREGLPKPREPRALGPVLTAAAKKGWCKSSGKFVRGTSVTRHGAPVAVWVSEIYFV